MRNMSLKLCRFLQDCREVYHVARVVRSISTLIHREARAVVAAFAFMTRIPVGRLIHYREGDLERATIWFPLVGVAVGATGSMPFLLFSDWWSPTVLAFLSVLMTILATGAFHEDALADSIDGFGGGWNRGQILEIMKDSRVGSYALVGMIVVIGLKVALLTQLQAAPDRPAWSVLLPPTASTLIAAHVLGRGMCVALIAVLPYARPAAVAGERQSAGRPFVNGVGRVRGGATIGLTFVLTWTLLGWFSILVIAFSVLITAVAGLYFKRRIGGITGDALGAANQIVELATYLVLASRPLAQLTP